jgi:mono/diheme cytochrome c family protein
MKQVLRLGLLALLAFGCTAAPTSDLAAPTVEAAIEPITTPQGITRQPGMGMGRSFGMMERHHAVIPPEYSGLTSPIAADEASITRGGEIFAVNCASCHGDGGMGDGIASGGLEPAPAPIAHTTQKMGDNYLFWRVSEGGAQFNSAMPAWKDILDEQARWDVIHYVRALGAGEVPPASQIGGAMYDAEQQAAHQAEMLAQAVAQGVITQDEANLFALVHEAVEQYRLAHPEMANSTLAANEREAAMLAELVKAQTLTQAQAAAFQELHDRLHEAGLMQ